MFDLQANLNPLFNWNAKQLFVFLMAEYETVDNKLNQVIYLTIISIILKVQTIFLLLLGCSMG